MNLSEIFARNLRVRMATLSLKTSDLYKMTGISKTTLMALQSGRNKGVQFTTAKDCTLTQLLIFQLQIGRAHV